jgi:hypothetical protein
MPLSIAQGSPTIFIRRSAFERVGLTRTALDERFNLTDEEFRVESGVIAVGPLVGDDALTSLIAELEDLGLAYFEDFFELTGNWPVWLRVVIVGG